MSTYEFLQVHTHEVEPDPAPDEAITANPFILNHDFKKHEQWGEDPELESSFAKIGDCEHAVILQHLPYFQCQDDEISGDIIDPRVLNTQTSQGPYDPDNPELYDAKDKELDPPPEVSLPVPPLLDQRS
jgi:hypothetical protein